MAPNNDLWVITGTSVVRYTSLGSSPTAVATIGGLSQPLAVAVHPSNNELVLVADGGSSDATLTLLSERLRAAFPGLRVAGTHSPPFRALTAEEDAESVARINASGAGVVFVSLGCPKQEKWMAAHRGRIRAVMFGVGAAFDFHAGVINRAPLWMQRCGLEWLHRLCSEPRRLWKRYLVTNTLFILGATRQLLFGCKKDR